MKTCILIVIVVLVISCKKDDAEPFNAKNKLDGTISFLSGEVKEFSSRGPSARIWCPSIGGTSIEANESPVPQYSPRAIYLGVLNSTFSCITGPGTFWATCWYVTNKSSQQTPVYMGTGVITYTAYDGKYAEGYFESYCKVDRHGTDSVKVKGTFSGYLK